MSTEERKSTMQKRTEHEGWLAYHLEVETLESRGSRGWYRGPAALWMVPNNSHASKSSLPSIKSGSETTHARRSPFGTTIVVSSWSSGTNLKKETGVVVQWLEAGILQSSPSVQTCICLKQLGLRGCFQICNHQN